MGVGVVTIVLLASHALILLLGMTLGRRLRSRRRFNAGVAAGRKSECLVHGWRDDPSLSARLPRKRRLWLLLNRQVVPGPTPRVLDDMPRH